MRLSIEHTIKAPSTQVFDAAPDFRGLAKRITGISKVEVLTDGQTKIGTRFEETRIFAGRQAKETMEVVALEKGRSITLEARSCGSHYLTSYNFVAVDGGAATKVTMEFVGRPEAYWAWAMVPIGMLFKGQMKKCVTQDLTDLAASIEGLEASASA